MENEYVFRFTAGVLIRKNLRMMLESERFAGRNIRWMEYKRWIKSDFWVRGNFEETKAVQSRVDSYMKGLGAA